MRKIFLFIIPFLFCVFSINAQNISAEENAAISLVSASKASLGLSAEDLSNVMVSSTYFDNASGIRMVYLNQAYKGIPVFNQILVLAYRGDKLVSQAGTFNHSLEKFAAGKSGMPAVTASSAVQSALSDRGLHASQMAIAVNTKDNGRKVEFSNMGVSRENITAQLMWTPVENSNEIHLSWHVYIIPKTTSDYWMVRVDAINNSILGMDNYTDYDNWGTPDVNGTVKYPAFTFGNMQANTGEKSFLDFKKADDPSVVTTATYRVIPFPAEAPSFANGAHALRTDPWLAAPGNATTLKWNTGAAATDYNYTRGNNVWAYQDRANTNSGSVGASASSSTALPNLTFDFTPNYTVDPTQTTPVPNQQFNTTNLFYWNNIIHDVMYIYGFTEASFNFQDDNMGRGGAGNDHVNAEAQDGSGSNNANFSTPADGGSGRMQMYLWNGGTPNRDGDVDNGVIVHEHGHGISNRLTGGGSGACLGNAEQMGEGWSDYYGLMFTQDWATATLNTGFNSPRGIGTYVIFQPPTGVGIRSQKYCTDFTINNKVYAASIPAESHSRGEIWCATLWDMTWNIINQAGSINSNLYNLAGGGGNAIALKLVTEGLKLQQCNPGFISGRNAILQADQNLYGGLYNCAIWEAFRRRGMGAFASEGSTGSVTDQIADFTPPITLGATVSATTIPEGSNLNYINSLATCSAISGYTLRDTLPTNVTYVSGGTYDAPNRVVSFAVNQAAGTTNYPFTVNVNPGSYFPPVTLFTEPVAGATIPAAWATTAPLGTVWTVSTTVSHSAPNSFYVQNLPADGDQRLATTAAYALPLNSYPELSFWHRFNTEDGWDGGVVEISTNGGTTWNDVGAGNMVLNGYNGGLGVSPNNPIGGRAAFTGLQATFINTKISLATYAGQSVMIRFRFGSDNNTTAPTSPAGWWVDDIVLNYAAAVNMRSSLFNASNTRVLFKDMVTLITQLSNCNPTINQQPVDATVCAGSSVSYTCIGVANGGVTYQWQLSTTGIGGTYTNLTNGAPYSNVTTSTLTVNPTVIGMNGYYFRCVVTGTCAPTATSNPARLSVATSSIPGTVTPANTNVCGTTNSGTLTVAGYNGNIVRWESATNIAGPWTAIANTTTTYTFNNITQTMYYRAVSQFGTCGETNSSIATVTFAAALPMTIIADPGTTICAGDPTLLTVVSGVATPVGILYTQTGASANGSPSQVFEPANAAFTSQSADDFTVPAGASWTVTQIGVVGTGAGVPTSVNVFFYANSGANLPGAAIASYNNVSTYTQAGGSYTVTLPTGLNLTAGTYWVSFQVNMGFATGGQWFWSNYGPTNVGSEYAWQNPGGGFATPCTAWGYGSTGCGVGGGVNRNNIFTITGTSLTSGGTITTGTFLWSPAAGLSSTTSNPVAASPMTTTTYTVNHNNGAGCIRQANITITVNQRPTITTNPVNSVNCAGTTATFTVGATGAGLIYQWQESTTGAGGPWNNLANATPYSGVNTATLNISPVTVVMNNNRYRCVVTGTCAPIGTNNISTGAILTVNGLPVVTVTPTGPVCGGVAGINGILLSTGSAAPPVPGSVTVNSGAISIPIPDNTPNGVSSNLTVAGIPANATITGARATWTLPHTWNGDMVFVLKSPNGSILNLDYFLSGTGGAGATTGFVNTTVSSAGVNALSTGTGTYTGTFKADAAAAASVPVAGPTGFTPTVTTWTPMFTPIPNGTWTLAMYDGGGLDFGTLTNWNITIDYTTPGGTGTPLTFTWSPAAGLYMNSIATIPYTAGTQTPSVYAAPTTFTAYTVTGTDGTTGCSNTATALVNYTPPAPAITPNPVAMCLGDAAVKLKSSSAIAVTPAVWTPAAGLFSDAAATVAYVAGTAVDSVWTRPTPSGVYNYQVTVQSVPFALPIGNPATNYPPGNTNCTITFNVKNNNTFPVTLSAINSATFSAGATNVSAYVKTSAINGLPGAISAANGWNQFGSAAIIGTTAVQPFMTGLTLIIPAGATYGICVQALLPSNAANLSYSNTTTPTVFSSGGCDIISGPNVGYGGVIIPAAPTFTPRGFIGSVLFVSPITPCTSPARTVVVTVNQPTTIATQPVAQTICTDKVAAFSVVAAGTGPFSYQWQVSTTGVGGTYTNIANGGVYSGATTATLTITAPPVSMNGYFYRVVINGAAPCAAATSTGVRLTVNPLPTIVISANRTSLFPGLTATLTSTVTPNAAASYTWLRNGTVVSGANTGTLTVDVDGLGDYQLRVQDVNGCTSVSNIITIKDSASGKCFIYPNPSSGKFQVRYYSVANNVLPRTLTVYDAKGDRMLTQMYSIGQPYGRMDVDMRAFGKGLYWVEIGDRNGNRITMCRVAIQ